MKVRTKQPCSTPQSHVRASGNLAQRSLGISEVPVVMWDRYKLEAEFKG